MSSDASKELVALGRRVLEQEAGAVAALAGRLDDRFAEAVRLLLSCRGRIIVSGVGKSGVIARKIAATLTSTGTPATFLHAVDSVHGDLGIVGRDDAAILISKSGETDELFGLVGFLKRLGVKIVAITGNARVHPRQARRRRARRGGRVPRPARSTSRRRPAPRSRSPSATRSPSRCSRPRGSSPTTSRGCIPAGRWAAACCCVVRDVMVTERLPGPRPRRLDAGVRDPPGGAARHGRGHGPSGRRHRRGHGRRPDAADGEADGLPRGEGRRRDDAHAEARAARRPRQQRRQHDGEARDHGDAGRGRPRPPGRRSCTCTT